MLYFSFATEGCGRLNCFFYSNKLAGLAGPLLAYGLFRPQLAEAKGACTPDNRVWPSLDLNQPLFRSAMIAPVSDYLKGSASLRRPVEFPNVP